MGNWPLLKALEELAKSNAKAKIRQIIFAAPDVDAKDFSDITKKNNRSCQGSNPLSVVKRSRCDGIQKRASRYSESW